MPSKETRVGVGVVVSNSTPVFPKGESVLSR